MTVLADGAGLYVGQVFAGRIGTVVAIAAIVRDVCVIEVGG